MSAQPEWGREIPSGWSYRRLRTLGRFSKGFGGSKEDNRDAGVPVVRYGDLYTTFDTVITKPVAYVDHATADTYATLRPGVLVMTASGEDRAEIGKAALSMLTGHVVVGGDAILFQPGRETDGLYLAYALQSAPAVAQKTGLSTGFTVVHITAGRLKTVSLPLPPVTEQRAIADYLDRETAKIDTLIEKQTTMIERLRERRAALSESVLAPFVGSGTRLRFLVRERDHRAGTRAQTLPLLSVSIATGVGARTDDNRQAASEDLSRYKIARRGDIVINRMRAFQGGLGASPSDGIVSPDYAVLGVVGDTDPAWMGAVMRTTSFVAEMSARLRGIGTSESGQVRTPRINVVDLLNIRMDVPSRSEQASILATLDRETAKIDTLIAKVERHIELAKERRAALITAAVTGQIDVTKDAA